MSRSFRTFALTIALLLALPVVLAACGASSSPSSSPTNVTVTETEFKITSSLTTFTTGTPYHFTITNNGKLDHEWLIVPQGVKDASKALVGLQPDKLTPGATVTVDYTFTSPGSYEMVCLLPGHYDAGMHTPITVN
jgi:uncharacterized cupredoxin-like copper-binding protein